MRRLTLQYPGRTRDQGTGTSNVERGLTGLRHMDRPSCVSRAGGSGGAPEPRITRMGTDIGIIRPERVDSRPGRWSIAFLHADQTAKYAKYANGAGRAQGSLQNSGTLGPTHRPTDDRITGLDHESFVGSRVELLLRHLGLNVEFPNRAAGAARHALIEQGDHGQPTQPTSGER